MLSEAAPATGGPGTGPARTGGDGTAPRRWVPVVLVGVVVAVFARTATFGLSLDDYVLARPWTLNEVLGAFSGPFDPSGFNDAYFRPLSSLSFAVEWHLWGTDAWGYHLTNIALHAAATVAVWAVLRRLRVPWWAAFAGGVVFAIVPSNAATAVYLAERTDAMVAICVCAALLCADRYASSHHVRWLVWMNVSYVVALLAKEVATAIVPMVAAFWLFVIVERLSARDPPRAAASVRLHWRRELCLIGRSIVDRSQRAGWLVVLGPLVLVTAGYLASRAAVMPAGSFGGRFGETQTPLAALVGGVNSTVKGVPWEVGALPYWPIIASLALGFVLAPRSGAWRVVLLGFACVVAGVAPLSFSGGVEPRLLYVAQIGMAIALTGVMTVFAETVATAHASRGRGHTVTAIVTVAVLAVSAAYSISHVRAQAVYEPGTRHALDKDLRVWTSREAIGYIPSANLGRLRQNLLDAGLIDDSGRPLDEASE